MKIQLRTTHGADFVHEQDIPPFTSPPMVIVWGTRVFTKMFNAGPRVDDAAWRYEEVFAYALPPVHLSDPVQNATHTCPRRGFPAGTRATDVRLMDDWKTRKDNKRTCSYCGSLHPNDFIDAVTAGIEIGPTDKDYKVYVKLGEFTKFYFQHLPKDQQQMFVDAINAKTVNIGAPGHFYVFPFFMTQS